MAAKDTELYALVFLEHGTTPAHHRRHHPSAVHGLETRRLQRTRILGELINEYSYAA